MLCFCQTASNKKIALLLIFLIQNKKKFNTKLMVRNFKYLYLHILVGMI